MDITLNQATEKFVEELKAREEVEGIILFGSWARGNQRPGSDVDLIVIVNEGYKRAVESHYDQVFEIIYLTSNAAIEYWNEHRDENARLWAVAKILYDKGGAVEILESKAKEFIAEGKKPIDSSRLGQLRFDAEDQLEYAKYVLAQGDAATANMIIENKAFALAQLYFDVKAEWVPAPKELLITIKDKNENLYTLLEDFYTGNNTFDQKLHILKKAIELIFDGGFTLK